MTATGDSMTPRERVLAALRRQTPDRVPYVENVVDPRVAQALAGDRILAPDVGVLAAMPSHWHRSDRGAEYTREGFVWLSAADKSISRIVGRDNITYWPAVSPQFLRPADPNTGSPRDGLIKTRDDLARMRFPRLDDSFFAPAEAFVAQKEDLAACAVVFLGIDPTWNSMGFENFSLSLASAPGFVEEVLGRYVEWTVPVVKRLCSIGFDFIWAADDIAFNTAPMFSPKTYRELLLPYTRRVAESITIPWIYHSDGNLVPLLEDMLTQGMNAIHPLEPGAMDPAALKARCGDRIALVGNINIDTLTLGTPEEVREEVRERIAELGPGGGYLLSSSNSVTSYCIPENVKAMAEAVREFGRYPLEV